MDELQGLGYHGITYGFFEDSIQTAYTQGCQCCTEHSVVKYIESVIISSKNNIVRSSLCFE